jgi:hypothetical protein
MPMRHIRRTRRSLFVWWLVCVAASRSALRTSTAYVHCRNVVCTTPGCPLLYDASSATCVAALNCFHTLHGTSTVKTPEVETSVAAAQTATQTYPGESSNDQHGGDSGAGAGAAAAAVPGGGGDAAALGGAATGDHVVFSRISPRSSPLFPRSWYQPACHVQNKQQALLSTQ